MTTVEQGVKAYMAYHKANSRPNSQRAFKFTLTKFVDLMGDHDVTSIPESDIATFLEMITDGCSQSTKNGRLHSILPHNSPNKKICEPTVRHTA